MSDLDWNRCPISSESATQAKEVSLVGDFNQCDPAANPINQMLDRSLMLQLELKHGHHRYAFMVDGVLTLNPRAPEHH